MASRHHGAPVAEGHVGGRNGRQAVPEQLECAGLAVVARDDDVRASRQPPHLGRERRPAELVLVVAARLDDAVPDRGLQRVDRQNLRQRDDEDRRIGDGEARRTGGGSASARVGTAPAASAKNTTGIA